MMGNTSGAGTVNPPGAPEFTSGFSGVCDDGQLVEQEMLTLLGHQSSPQVLVGFVTMGNTSGAGTANPSGAPEFTSGFSGVCDDGQH